MPRPSISSRISATRLILSCLAIAGVISGCDSYEPCHQHFGDRTLPGEEASNPKIPTRLVAACMYGAEVVGPILLHQSTPEAECQKKYNAGEISKGAANITREVSNVLEEMDACVAGGKGFVRQVLRLDDVPPELNNCEKVKGQYNINPNLPCD